MARANYTCSAAQRNAAPRGRERRRRSTCDRFPRELHCAPVGQRRKLRLQGAAWGAARRRQRGEAKQVRAAACLVPRGAWPAERRVCMACAHASGGSPSRRQQPLLQSVKRPHRQIFVAGRKAKKAVPFDLLNVRAAERAPRQRLCEVVRCRHSLRWRQRQQRRDGRQPAGAPRRAPPAVWTVRRIVAALGQVAAYWWLAAAAAAAAATTVSSLAACVAIIHGRTCAGAPCRPHAVQQARLGRAAHS